MLKMETPVLQETCVRQERRCSSMEKWTPGIVSIPPPPPSLGSVGKSRADRFMVTPLVIHKVNGEKVLEYTSPQIGGGVANGYDPAIKI